MNTPLVSICCITYNHAQFIRKCLDGFLMQQTNFPIEILIHDDCSTDGTTEIIREYEAKYPNLIFPLYEEENQYQQGKAAEIDFYNYRRARGKYIAYCEGDDYWTDLLKLQKQVDFMEANPEYSVCFHACQKYDVGRNKYIQRETLHEDCDIDLDVFLNSSQLAIAQPLTMLFRRSKLREEWKNYNSHYCDTVEITHLLLEGKGRFLSFNGGQYNSHTGGVCSSKSEIELSRYASDCARELWEYTQNDFVRKFYINNVKWNLDVYGHNIKSKEYRKILRHSLQFNTAIRGYIFKYCIKKILKKLMNNKQKI